MSCSFHIFEPRYRLLMRRVLAAGGGQFGMCLPRGHGPAEHGTLMSIESHTVTVDGRLLICCKGLRKFRVRELSTKDGYYGGSLWRLPACLPCLLARLQASTVHMLMCVVPVGAVDWVDDEPAAPAAVPAAAAAQLASLLVALERSGGRWRDEHGDPPAGSCAALSYWVLAVAGPAPDTCYDIFCERNAETRLVRALAAAAVPVRPQCPVS